MVVMSESPEVCQFSSTVAISQHCYTTYLHQIEYRDFLKAWVHLTLLIM